MRNLSYNVDSETLWLLLQISEQNVSWHTFTGGMQRREKL